MFTRSFAQKSRVGKASKLAKPPSFKRTDVRERMLEEKMMGSQQPSQQAPMPMESPPMASSIVTIVVGQDQRLFAAHEDVLCHSPYFAAALQGQYFDPGRPDRRIHLPHEEAEVFSCVLEYLYKGDYQPRLLHNKRRNTWHLEGQQHAGPGSPDSLKSSRAGAVAGSESATVYHSGVGDMVLRDTAVYCSAGRYGLDELQRLALRKQGLQSGIEVATILRSARYAYDNTPDSDSRLRAHYLALIIRSRRTFKRSGTMQMEMEMGGRLFFDLFVAMCNHMDDLTDATQAKGTPRTV